MKQVYYYFLFRLFCFYKKKYKNNADVIFWVTIASSMILFFNFFIFYGLVNYFDLIPIVKNKYWVLLVMLVISIINYYFFIRKNKFLDYNFTEDKKGGWKIIAYIVFTAAMFIVIANFNREKIFTERKTEFSTEQSTEQNSLENEIRNWWKNR